MTPEPSPGNQGADTLPSVPAHLLPRIPGFYLRFPAPCSVRLSDPTVLQLTQTDGKGGPEALHFLTTGPGAWREGAVLLAGPRRAGEKNLISARLPLRPTPALGLALGSEARCVVQAGGARSLPGTQAQRQGGVLLALTGPETHFAPRGAVPGPRRVHTSLGRDSPRTTQHRAGRPGLGPPAHARPLSWGPQDAVLAEGGQRLEQTPPNRPTTP